jgi:hypothetical protein
MSWLTSPGDVVAHLRAGATPPDGNVDWDGDWSVAASLESFLEVAAVPAVHLPLSASAASAMQCGQLVRVRCMVQDVFGTELYRAEAAPGVTNRFGANFSMTTTIAPDASAPDDTVCERTVLACVRIPGESEWAHYDALQSDKTAPPKRKADGKDGGRKSKRAAKESGPAPSATSEEMMIEERDGGDSLSECEPPDCIVKVYRKEDREDRFRVNQAHEFVGIIEIACEGDDDVPMPVDVPAEFEESARAKNPPVSRTPRIHVLTHRPLEVGNGHPALTLPFSTAGEKQ